MLLRFYGIEAEPRWLRTILEQTAVGMSGSKVRNLTRYGFHVEYRTARDERVLLQSLAQGQPPILLVETQALSYWHYTTYHAVVLVALDDQYATLNDPFFAAQQVVPRDELLLAWSDFGWHYALIAPGADIKNRLP